MTDKDTAVYKCKEDGFFYNYPLLDYPTEITATCNQNQLFEGLLSFWQIPGITFPAEGKNLCIDKKECLADLPKVSSVLTHTWNGSILIDTQFIYFCEMGGLRGLEIFNTSNDGKEAIEAINASVEFFKYRSSNSKAVIKLRTVFSEKVYIYLSTHQKIENQSYVIEVESGNIKILSVDENQNFNLIKAKGIPKQIDQTYDLWLGIQTTNKLYIGSWKPDGETTTHILQTLDFLDHLYFVGFSSFSHATWEVQNGKSNNRSRHKDVQIIFLVGPGGKIFGYDNLTQVNMTCKNNKFADMALEWMMEPDIDKEKVLCIRYLELNFDSFYTLTQFQYL